VKETISYPRGTKMGRPPAIVLLPDDAQIVRDAVTAATRYYGIRQQDLGSWVIAAMRKSAEMSVETAERLFRRVQQPDASLVKGKPAKGMTLLDAQSVIKLHAEDPEANPLPEDPAIEYVLKMFEVARVVNYYARPMPGSTFFVLPKTSRQTAEAIVESFAEETQGLVFGDEVRRKLVEHLSFYFEVAERPLREVQNKTLLDNLGKLGLLNRFDLANELGKSYPEEELYDPVPGTIIEALVTAETQRNVKTNPAPAPRKRKRQGR
jgi:hypothetical protein